MHFALNPALPLAQSLAITWTGLRALPPLQGTLRVGDELIILERTTWDAHLRTSGASRALRLLTLLLPILLLVMAYLYPEPPGSA